MRVVFMGTAELACASLKALSGSRDYRVVAVVTQPDRPKGRKLQLTPPPVKVTAMELGLPVLQPQRARNPEFIQELAALAPELIVVAAYGQILPPAILDMPTHGCINVHTSLLPKYRGAAPIQWAILNGDAETGVTIMKMDPGLDTGPILSQQATPITPQDNAETLHDRLAALGAELLVKTIPGYVAGRVLPQPQPSEGANYARKIAKEDGLLDWSLPARTLFDRVRALTPWPGAYTYFGDPGQPRLLKVWAAELVEGPSQPGIVLSGDPKQLVIGCGEQALRLMTVQTEGGRRLDAAAFLAGHSLKPGEKLG